MNKYEVWVKERGHWCWEWKVDLHHEYPWVMTGYALTEKRAVKEAEAFVRRMCREAQRQWKKVGELDCEKNLAN